MQKVILDTDIGTDIDDILALSLLLASPEIELLGITTAYGDTRLRAKIVHQVLRHVGRAGVIPIAPGGPTTLNGERKIFWPGHEGKNLDPSIPDSVMLEQSAEDFIIEAVTKHPGEITLIAVAPQANLARAILKAPEVMREVKQIFVMGGVFDLREPEFPVVEHNIASDPEAAQVVFDFGLPITLLPLDVTTRTWLGPDEVARLGASPHPLAQLLFAELSNWMPFIKERHGRDFTHMHDPLTVAALVQPELITRRDQMKVRVEAKGEYTLGMTVPDRYAQTGNVQVAFDIDVPAFQKMFFEQVINAGAPDPAVWKPLSSDGLMTTPQNS